MTKKEYVEEIKKFQEDFRYCFATNNTVEAKRILKDMRDFVKTYSHNLQNEI